MWQACPGCALANPTKGRPCKLVYNLLIKVPFLVLYIDAYFAGAYSGFGGSDIYLDACCSMSTFSSIEPPTGANSTTFASAIMKIQHRYGFCHTVLLDKDSKFYDIFCKSLDLLKINCHMPSGDNHNPMIVKRLCQYFNECLHQMGYSPCKAWGNPAPPLHLEFMPSFWHRPLAQLGGGG